MEGVEAVGRTSLQSQNKVARLGPAPCMLEVGRGKRWEGLLASQMPDILLYIQKGVAGEGIELSGCFRLMPSDALIG